ncbi:glutamine--fructose-6-phosphate transaminase (isomerizing) [Pelagibius marinus]|uniref:glutamine--fructose-6-phosphate transaminase (isomerizing) n=1 Tax=Pelagibius marinus TaxID=2762760 RepID=UPI001872B081|nr:glutamine--fructose-6-phosphate transaminase (isomerizing) [Pelagibius marinus]
MCGIVGFIGSRPAVPVLMEGLRRLEYRGYDSAGVATLINGAIDRRRAVGKVSSLQELLDRQPLEGTIGIGHTRWATHGSPSELNAHPHANERVALVHNGIIENHQLLRAELEAKGHVFTSQTDSEVIAHLVSDLLDRQFSPQNAVAAALKRLEGVFAIVLVFAGRHDLVIGAKRGSPLAVGVGDGEMYLGSDALALAHLTDRIIYLEEGDWVEVSCQGCVVHDVNDQPVVRQMQHTAFSGALIGKGDYRHYMLKEICEQPMAIGETLSSLVDPVNAQVVLPELPFDLATVSRFTFCACGTAFLAAAVAKYWFEQLARQPVEIDIASEFRYREAPMPNGGVGVFVSQSGETIDTLSALRYVRTQGQPVLSIVNVPESAIARESDCVLPTLAGPEIGVASTKAFTTQLTVLACLALAVARTRKTTSPEELERLTLALISLPKLIDDTLLIDGAVRNVAASLAGSRDALYLGRGSLYPIAMEGALKLKELTYIHAEGYAAGEMKHGPIALIDEQMPVIVCAPVGPLFEKTAANVQEVLARGGRIILVSDRVGIEKIGRDAEAVIEVPPADNFIAPMVYSIPVQLLAYHTAVFKGTDVDQPRNLAKSVTVE